MYVQKTLTIILVLTPQLTNKKFVNQFKMCLKKNANKNRKKEF